MAVKLLKPTTAPDRVLQEARLQRRLSKHRRIVEIRNVELGANPSSFIAMELIPGGSLQDVLDRRRPTVLESHRWICDALDAIDHAHQEGVLHRDIKPSNLLLGADGHALLTDFGVAEDSIRRSLPEAGMYPLTVPPEFGKTGTTVQTDLWLIGVLAWQLLVGHRPELAAAHGGTLEAPHRFSPEVPMRLSRAIMPALAPDPAQRPPDAARMLETVASVPIHCGWHDVAVTEPTVRCWRADDAGNNTTVAIRRRARGGYLIEAKAPPGSRLRARRQASERTEAAAIRRARGWLTEVVAGNRL